MSKTIKLIKGLSYFGVVNATKDNPIVENVDDNKADLAVKSGYFAYCEIEGQPENGGGENNPSPEKKVDNMKTDELEAFAKELGVDLSQCKNNEERKAAIKAFVEGQKQNDE